jgi:Na+/H+-dicarboxylate symporter
VVIFTIIIGLAITQLSQKTASSIIRFSEAIKKICMIVISWAMMLVPYALFGLMAALLSRTRIEVFFGLGYYMRVVLLGLILLLTFYLVLVLAVTKRNPSNF